MCVRSVATFVAKLFEADDPVTLDSRLEVMFEPLMKVAGHVDLETFVTCDRPGPSPGPAYRRLTGFWQRTIAT